ncbi:hypothetical protein JCM11491_005657 [Sporobolomyces phaffii]
MATYDNGLYTPWTPAAADPGAPPTTTTAQAVVATSTTVWWTPPTTTTTSPVAPSPTSSSTSTSSSTTTMMAASTSPSSSSSSSPPSSSSVSSGITPSSSPVTSSSALASSASGLHPSGVIAASSADSASVGGPPPFKVTYLLPVFIIVPCVVVFLVAAWTYGKYWARPRTTGDPSSRPQDQPGFWDGGAYKSIGGASRRGRADGAIDDEKDGLVIGKDWAGGHVQDLERATTPPKRKWSDWLALGRGASTRSNASSSLSSNHVPFVSVSYASLEQPFVPPASTSSHALLARSASQMSNRAGGDSRGWTWGARGPHATPSALRVMNADDNHDDDDDEEDESARYLTAARGWNGAGSTTRKYRAKTSGGSLSSRISDKVMGRRLSPNAQVAPSPSVYSPQFSPAAQDAGRYTELDDDDDDDDDKNKVDLDAYLGESRVGHGRTANRYLNGDASALPPPPRRASARAGDGDGAPDVPVFAVNLPSAPPRTQVSPKKSQSTLLRVPAPESPRATPPPPPQPRQLLFNYDSPPPPRGPLPVPVPTSHSTDPFTAPPARVPFRSQPAPQLSRPSRTTHSSTPFSPETSPGLFFASPPLLSSPPSSSSHQQREYSSNVVVGSPMPDFQPGALRASESAFSIAGVDSLIFADPASASSAPPPSNAFMMNPASRAAAAVAEKCGPRPGLKEYVHNQPKMSRKEEIEQLRRSVGGPPRPSPVGVGVGVGVDPNPPPPPGPALAHRRHDREERVVKAGPGPRESLGFDPTFTAPAELAPLQHPSRVRAAIETLEAKSSSHTKSSPSVDSSPSRTVDDDDAPPRRRQPRPERLPSPPASQKLERSTTTLGRTTRRHHHHHHEGENDDDDRNDDVDEETIMNRRVSTLLLSRSRTQSGPPAAAAPGSASSHDSSHESASERGRGSEEEPTTSTTSYRRRTGEGHRSGSTGGGDREGSTIQRPLSSDPARLQQMLRRKSTGANLGGITTEGAGGGPSTATTTWGRDEGNEEDGIGGGGGGGGILAAMTRRSGIFE